MNDRNWHYGDIWCCKHKEKRHPISEVASASFRRIHAARPGAGLGFHSDLLTVLAQTHDQINSMGLYVVSDKSGISVEKILNNFSAERIHLEFVLVGNVSETFLNPRN